MSICCAKMRRLPHLPLSHVQPVSIVHIGALLVGSALVAGMHTPWDVSCSSVRLQGRRDVIQGGPTVHAPFGGGCKP